MTRALVFVLLAFVLMTIATPLLRMFGFELVGVDIPTIFVLYMALNGDRRPVLGASSLLRVEIGAPGAASALLLGYLADLLGGGIKGATSLALAGLYLTARALSRQVAISGAVSAALITFAATLPVSIIVALVRWTQGVAPSLALAGLLLGQAVLTAALAPALMRLLRFIESKLSREADGRSPLPLS
ncbi:MAG: hypothetical protein KC503_26895 [Myxococcales bacterium]|nr:hypothetical protein [Myxococcales bacterium]